VVERDNRRPFTGLGSSNPLSAVVQGPNRPNSGRPTTID
jgi:hypothetical protein